MPSDGQPLGVLDTHAVSRDFGRGSREVHAVRGVTLRVLRGEVVAVMGPSGCGKTTLLHLLGGLEAPDAGRVTIEGVDWQTLSARDRSRVRRQRCGFIF